MSDIALINDSQQSAIVTNGIGKNGEIYMKAAGSTDEGSLVVYDSGSWRKFADEASSFSAYSVDFDGSNDYMSFGTPTLFNTGSAFSFSAWIKIDSYSSNTYQTIAQFKTNHSNGFQLLASATEAYTGLNIGSNDSTNMLRLKTAGDISSTFLNWTHIAMTYNGSGGSTSSNYKIYINGSEVSTTTSGAYAVLSNANSIAAGNSGGSFHFVGLIDEVATFSSELSSSNITSIYNSGEPADLSSYSPVSWWRMGDDNSGAGTTITDQGSGGNDGTLTNGPTFSSSVPS